MKQLNKCVLFFIMLFFNTTYLFADIGNRGRWDNTGCMSIIATIVGLLVLVSMCSH